MLVVEGKASDRRSIESWLRQIWGQIEIDHQSGEARLGTAWHTPYNSGDPALQRILSSEHCVRIVPLPSPSAEIPGTRYGLERFYGGVAFPDSGDQHCESDGNPGPGCGATIYIDISANDGLGYFSPMWLILAHELTTGHAYHMISGTHERVFEGQERQARQSENVHALAHGLSPRLLE